MRKASTYKDVVDALKSHDSLFSIDPVGGKGSHRMVAHPHTKKHYPLPYHGYKTSIRRGILLDLIRIFELPPDIFS